MKSILIHYWKNEQNSTMTRISTHYQNTQFLTCRLCVCCKFLFHWGCSCCCCFPILLAHAYKNLMCPMNGDQTNHFRLGQLMWYFRPFDWFAYYFISFQNWMELNFSIQLKVVCISDGLCQSVVRYPTAQQNTLTQSNDGGEKF